MAWDTRLGGGTGSKSASTVEDDLLDYVDSKTAGLSYYVDPAGSDSNSGLTPALAWATLAKVNSFTFAARDSILFKRGATFRGSGGGGSTPMIQVSSSDLTFGAYGTGAKPIISGGDLVTGWSVSAGSTYQATMATLPASIPVIITYTTGDAVTLLAKGSGSGSLTANQWFWASGVMYVNLGGTNPTSGVVEIARRLAMDAYLRNNITIQNIKFTHNHDACLALADSTASGHQVLDCDFQYQTMDNHAGCIYFRRNPGTAGCKVLRCTFDQMANEAVYVDSTKNVEFGWCTITNSGNMALDQQTDGIQIQNDVATYNSDGFWIHDNRIAMGATTVKGCIIVQTDTTLSGTSASGIIERNDCSGGHFGVAIHSNNVTARNNVIHDITTTDGSGLWLDETGNADITGIIFAYNLIYNCDTGLSAALGPGTSGRSVTIVNNTIVNSIKQYGWLNARLYGTIANNVFWNTGVMPTTEGLLINSVKSGQTLVVNNNIYNPNFTQIFQFGATPYNTIAAWRSATGFDAASIQSDPLLVNPVNVGGNYALAAGSPAIDAGIYVASVHAYNAASGTPDIGYGTEGVYAVLSGTPVTYRAKDSGADDTAALQAAITALPAGGGTILLPDPLYLVTSLAIPASPKTVTLIGGGVDATVIKEFTSAVTSLTQMIDVNTSGGQLYVRDMTLQGPTSVSAANIFNLLHQGAGTGGLIDCQRVRLYKFGYGIWSENTTIRLRDFVIDGGSSGTALGSSVGGQGVLHAPLAAGLFEADTGLITNCGHGSSNLYHGLYIEPIVNQSVRNVRFTNLYGTGFHSQHYGATAPGDYCNYSGCYFGPAITGLVGAGFAPAGSVQTTLDRCVFALQDNAILTGENNANVKVTRCTFQGLAGGNQQVAIINTGCKFLFSECDFLGAPPSQIMCNANGNLIEVVDSRFAGAASNDIDIEAGLTTTEVFCKGNRHTGATARAYLLRSGKRITTHGSQFLGGYSVGVINAPASATVGILNTLDSDFSQTSGSSAVLTVAPTTVYKLGNYGSVGYP